MASSIRTCLWFRDGRGRQAAEFYCSLIPGSRVETVFVADNGPNTFSVIDFSLGGVPYQILDAGPHFTLTEAVSISVATDDQAESDRLWGGADCGRWRGKSLRMAERSLRGVLASLSEAIDRIDDKRRQKCVCQGDGGYDETDENRHRRN